MRNATLESKETARANRRLLRNKLYALKEGKCWEPSLTRSYTTASGPVLPLTLKVLAPNTSCPLHITQKNVRARFGPNPAILRKT